MGRGRHRRSSRQDDVRAAEAVPAPPAAISEPVPEDTAVVGGWWSPLARALRTDVDAAAGHVNVDRDRYRLGEWVRWGQAMAAFTIDDPAEREVATERVRRLLVLHVVVADTVAPESPAFTADGVDWVRPVGHSAVTNIDAGVVTDDRVAIFLSRVAQQVGEAARVGPIEGTMAAFSQADAWYLTRGTR